MSAVTTFDSTKELLLAMLHSIDVAKTQLPDFQRGWVWDDDHILSLLASISLSYPVGTVMMLETGNEEVHFKPRLVEGVSNANGQDPERLILDGQQRLTSLYMATLSGKAVETRDVRKKTIKRWYYIDMKKALSPNGDREEFVMSIWRIELFGTFVEKYFPARISQSRKGNTRQECFLYNLCLIVLSGAVDSTSTGITTVTKQSSLIDLRQT